MGGVGVVNIKRLAAFGRPFDAHQTVVMMPTDFNAEQIAFT